MVKLTHDDTGDEYIPREERRNEISKSTEKEAEEAGGGREVGGEREGSDEGRGGGSGERR